MPEHVHVHAPHELTEKAEHVSGPWRYERIEGASHWLQLDAPDRVNELLLEFLG